MDAADQTPDTPPAEATAAPAAPGARSDGRPGAVATADSDRAYAMWIHVGALLGAIAAAVSGGIGFWAPILIVLVMWMIRRDRSAFVDDHGREAINFQISLIIYFGLAMLTFLCGVGILLGLAVIIGQVIFLIFAAIAAQQGQIYRFPVTIRLVPSALR